MGEYIGRPDLGEGLLRHDVPEELVNNALDRQRRRPLFSRYDELTWQHIIEEKPSLRHYIVVSSFELAPDDPVMREKITRAQLGLLSLLDEAAVDERFEEIVSVLQGPITGEIDDDA